MSDELAVIDDRIGPRWSRGGPIVVDDGLEDPARLAGRMIAPACLACGDALAVDVTVVLHGRGALPHQALPPGALSAFRLRTTTLGTLTRISTSLGLQAHAVVVRCPRCVAAHLVVLGYGEYQPARYVVTYDGAWQMPAASQV